MSIIAKVAARYPAQVMFFLDLLVVALVSVFAFLLRFDGVIPAEKLDALFAFTLLALAATPASFYAFGLYRISWSYVSLTDLPAIGKGAVGAAVLAGAAVFLLRDLRAFEGFPRSVIISYAVLLFLLAGGLRFAKRVYWQMVRGGSSSIEMGGTAREDSVRPSAVVVTGGAGYIGSVLVPRLLEEGYGVKVIDKGLFGYESLKGVEDHPNFRLVQGDIGDVKMLERELTDADAVVHLAAVVGEAACSAQKDVALQTNYLSTMYLARLCKRYGISRFLYVSTCSTYGKAPWEDAVSERSEVRPVDFYGETKIYVERELARLADDQFAPTILRLSTVYGLSPRMRFDLVVNTLTKKAVTEGEIRIFGGEQWRPLVHTQDVARAVLAVLASPLSVVGNQIFNVGGDEGNYTISQLGDVVQNAIPGTRRRDVDTIADNRSYRVSFQKIADQLGFSLTKTVEDGVQELRRAFEESRFADPDDAVYYNHRV